MYQQYFVEGFVIRSSDGMLIPADPGNRDYQEVQVWLDAGGKLLPPDPIPGVQTSA